MARRNGKKIQNVKRIREKVKLLSFEFLFLCGEFQNENQVGQL